MVNQEYTFASKIMIRNGKIVFSEEASQFLRLTEKSYVKLGVDSDSTGAVAGNIIGAILGGFWF